MSLTLDVGCGHNPQGHVNVDLYTKATIHRGGDASKDCDLQVRNIPNFVKADATHLPFRSNVFDEVYSHHAIEHVPKPFIMLKEMVRVSSDKIFITCPHRYVGDHKSQPGHINHFNEGWFEFAISKLGVRRHKITLSQWRCFPRALARASAAGLPLIRLPAEIEITIQK